MELEILAQPRLAEVQAEDERQGNLLQDYEQTFEKKKLPKGQKLSKLCSEAGLNLVEVGQFFYHHLWQSCADDKYPSGN